MSYTESLFFLFCDSFFAAFALTMSNEMAVTLMTILPGYNINITFALGLLGSVVGSFVNWNMGRFFHFLYKTDFFVMNFDEIASAQAKWNKFLVYILLLSWIPIIGGPFAILAGFFKTTLRKFLLLVVSSKVVYYYLFVFQQFDLLGW